MTAPGLPDAPDASDAAEPSRDAWLREALRHAPDAQIEAPPALSAAILREARAAVASRRPIAAASANRWSAAWAWLARPSVATGFASLMVAGFVGLLWRNGPIDPLPAEPAPALRRADSSPAAVGPASAPAVPTAPLAPQGGAARLDAPPDRPVLAPAQRPPVPPVARAQKSEVAPRAPPRDAAAKEVARPELLPWPAPAEPAAPSAAPAAEAARDTAARAEARMRSDPATAAASATLKLTETPALQGRLADRRISELSSRGALQTPAPPSPQAAIAELRWMAPAAAAPTPAVAERLRVLRARLADEPGRWRWQLDDGARRPVDTALLDWLAGLERALVPGPTDAGRAVSGATLTLWRDGQRADRIALHLATATLTLDDVPARLDPAALAALQAELADLAR